MPYIDTSVVVAALTRETRTADMQVWLAAQPPRQLIISDWVVTEFSAALSMKVRMQRLDAELRAAVLTEFGYLKAHTFTVWPVTREQFRIAARLADGQGPGLRAGDALHLAIAADRGVPLVSLDKGLVDAAIMSGIAARLL